MAYIPPPRHIVIVFYDENTNLYTVECCLCGKLDTFYSWDKANNLRATHLKSTP